MADAPPEAVRLALAEYRSILDDRPTPTALSDETMVRKMLEAAMPAIERDIRVRIAASLRRAAEGRREYAATGDGGNEHIAEVNERLRIAALAHESSARLIEDPRHILDVIPAWRWTDEEHASLFTGEDEDRG